MVMAVAAMLWTPVTAQDEERVPDPHALTLGELVEWQIKLMAQKEWLKALVFCNQSIKDEGDGALQQWGPLFGSIYYRKGFCEMKLKRWPEAMKSFEICHRDFRNVAGAMNRNDFEHVALLRWADAAMATEKWQIAVNVLEDYLATKDVVGPFKPDEAFFKAAQCYEELGNDKKAAEYRAKALELHKKP